MRRGLWRTWLPAVAAAGLIGGCESSHASRYPPDPLLLSKKPVESRPQSDPSTAVARREPQAPRSLFIELASRNAPAPSPVLPTSLPHDDEEH